jgi:hypothetical protein
VAEHDDERRGELRRRKFDAADLRRCDDVAGDADHEQVAETLVEDELDRDAGIRAAEDHREGFLARHELAAPRLAGQGVETAHARREAAVAFAQPIQCVACSRHQALS